MSDLLTPRNYFYQTLNLRLISKTPVLNELYHDGNSTYVCLGLLDKKCIKIHYLDNDTFKFSHKSCKSYDSYLQKLNLQQEDLNLLSEDNIEFVVFFLAKKFISSRISL